MVVLRLASLTAGGATNGGSSWLSATAANNNHGPVSISAAVAVASKNQQRMERRRQRQDLLRQRQEQNSGISNINNKMGEAAIDEQRNTRNVVPPFREHDHPDLMNPHDSTPPNAISLFSHSATTAATSLLYLSKTALQRRHECIAAIRKRHDEILGPLFLTTAPIVSHQLEEEEEDHLPRRIAASITRPRLKKVLLVDPAYHKNVGDHMITLGEMAFLQRMGYATTATTRPRETNSGENLNAAVYEECTYIQGGPFLPLCDDFLLKRQQQQHENVSSSSFSPGVALWHGGGNWGDLWPKVQSMRASSLEPLFAAHYNPIISMPQSLYFDDEKIFQKENTNVMRQAVMKYMKQETSTSTSIKQQQGLNISLADELADERRLILTWREQESHASAKNLYPFATHLVVPDIAFQLGPYAPIIDEGGVGGVENDTKQGRPQLDILLLLRDDHESLYLHQRNRQAIRQLLDSITVKRRDGGGGGDVAGNRLAFAIVDWQDRLDRFESSSSSFGKNDIFFTNTSIQLLSLGRVLVCDRLHAAILAYLMGIPFVFVDQLTGKIHRTLHTAFASVSFLNDTTAAAEAADQHALPCMDATTAMWAQAENLTHALEKAIGFIESGS